jgi:LuxR family maltose regulon positive regulatory protein
MALGAPARALALLARLAQADEAGERIGNLIEVRILQALALAQCGDNQASLQTLEQALALGAGPGYRRAFLDEGAALAPLLRAAAQERPQAAYAASLLAALGAGASPVETTLETNRRRARVLALKPAQEEPLTLREIEILKLVVAGKSNPQIAGLLYLSLNTVKVHLKNIYGKLGVESRTQAVGRYHELKLD